MIFDVQPKGFPDLQTLRARLFLDLQPARCPIGECIAHTFPFGPIHAAKDSESLWCGFFEIFQMCIKDIFAPTAVEIDILSHAGFIEQIQQLAQWLMIPASAEWLPE